MIWWVQTEQGASTPKSIRTSYRLLLDLSKRGFAGHVLLARPDAGAVADEALRELRARDRAVGYPVHGPVGRQDAQRAERGAPWFAAVSARRRGRRASQLRRRAAAGRA